MSNNPFEIRQTTIRVLSKEEQTLVAGGSASTNCGGTTVFCSDTNQTMADCGGDSTHQGACTS